MLFSPIYNALLRIDDISGEPPPPFEKPRHDLNFWVLELPGENMSVSNWCAQTMQTLSSQTESLHQAHLAGGQSSLFIESAAGVPVLRLEANFLRLLADLGVSLECVLATNA